MILAQDRDAVAGLETKTPQCLRTLQGQTRQLCVADGTIVKGPGDLVRGALSVVKGMEGEITRWRYDEPPSLGMGNGNGVMLEPSVSVIFATPSFSTSSIRMTAVMGMKER